MRRTVSLCLSVVGLLSPLQAFAQTSAQQLAEAGQRLDEASTKARRAGGTCKSAASTRLADAADSLEAQRAKPALNTLSQLSTELSDLNTTATFNDCPEEVLLSLGSGMELVEAARATLWNERQGQARPGPATFAELAPLLVRTNETFEGEAAVRVSVPELTLRGLKGQAFYFGAKFRSLQGNWSPWVTTQQWSVPADPFSWTDAFTHVLRASALADEDFANGRFLVQVAVFDGQGKQLTFREVRVNLSTPTAARDCGTGTDLGCSQTRDGAYPVERAGYLALLADVRAEKNQPKRAKRAVRGTAQLYLTAAQFTQLLDLFKEEPRRLDVAKVLAARVVNLADAKGYGSRFSNPDHRAGYAELLQQLLNPDATPRAWRAEGDMDWVGFSLEAPTKEALFQRCRTWKETGHPRIQGFVFRVALKNQAPRTGTMNTDGACGVVRDGARPVY